MNRNIEVDLLNYLQDPKLSREVFAPAWKLKPDINETWAYDENVFTKNQCEAIIKIGKNLKLKKSMVGGDDNHRGTLDDWRISNNSWISPQPGTAWIFGKLTNVILDINSKFFNFDITAFSEGLQFTEYESPGGKYDMHVDTMRGGSTRKLSITVQLSDMNDYEGGDFVINVGNEIMIPKKQGMAVVFPSYMLHGVKPVTKGTRYSLVAWIDGPAFK